MIRITKVTDHGIVLLTRFALAEHGTVFNARDLADAEDMTQPMVAKILKILVGGGILESHRGVKGGYSLARRPETITLEHIVAAMEGPIAVTECSVADFGSCDRESFCNVRPHWRIINESIRTALERVTLLELAAPEPAPGLAGQGE